MASDYPICLLNFIKISCLLSEISTLKSGGPIKIYLFGKLGLDECKNRNSWNYGTNFKYVKRNFL